MPVDTRARTARLDGKSRAFRALHGLKPGLHPSGKRSSGTQSAGRQTETAATEADLIRATERERLRGLVAGDASAVRDLHADDFQLINPSGAAVSKEQYLSDVASGVINYLVWEPGAIEVRLYGEGAVIRYQSQLEIILNGQPAPLRPMWHTDVYEKCGGRWQVVWSQATIIQ